MKNFLMIVPAVLLAACATTAPQRPVADPRITAMERRIADQQAEIERLKQVPVAEAPQVMPVADQIVVQQDLVPPAQPILPGPPQNMGWPYTPPNGCENGPFRLSIHNWFRGYYVQIFIDGEEGNFRLPAFPSPRDGKPMTAIPPRGSGRDPVTVNVCLNHLGEHTISGVVYGNRAGVLVEIGRFNENRTFSNRAGRGQSFNLLDELL